MRIYIAPVCDWYLSHTDTNDPALLDVETIYFDILEVSARADRIKLNNLPDSAMSTEMLSKTFNSIVREMHENRLRMNRAFHKELFRDTKENALKKW